MLLAALKVLASIGGTADVDERIVSRCERSAWPQECLEAGQTAMHSIRLVSVCRRGLDPNRFGEDERARAGVPIPQSVLEQCGSVQKACIANLVVFYDRRRSGEDIPLPEREAIKRASEECSLENFTLID